MCLADDKWVRIMCDYSADGVWAKNGGAAMLSSLPVSPDLLGRIRRWQDWFETSPIDDSGWPDIDAFCEEGEEIARVVKAALPDWTVVYFHEAKYEAVWKGLSCKERKNVPRDRYEYEIT